MEQWLVVGRHLASPPWRLNNFAPDMDRENHMRTCYVVLPAQSPSSLVLWREAIQPLFAASSDPAACRCALAADVYSMGMALSSVTQVIGNADVLLADFTGRDASVALQVGMAVAAGKPIVPLLATSAPDADVPFDLHATQPLRYDPQAPATPAFVDQLRAALQAVAQPTAPARPEVDLGPHLRRLATGDRHERREAEQALLQHAGKSAIGPLCDMLVSDDPGVRASAGLVLRHIDDEQVVDELVARFGDARPYVRRAIAWVLSQIQSEAAANALMHRLQDDAPVVRKTAAWALGELREFRALQLLTATLDDEDPDVRREAVQALGKLGDPASVPRLLQVLARDPEPMVRQAAAAALGETHNVSAVPALIAATRDRGWVVRQSAARALGQIGDPTAASSLEALVRDITEDVRWAAVCGLAEIGDPGSRAALARTAADQTQALFIRELASAALVEDDAEGSAGAA